MGSPKTRMQRQHATLRPFAARSHAGANDLSATDEEEEEASDEEEDTSEEEEEASEVEEASLLTPAGIVTGQEAALCPSPPVTCMATCPDQDAGMQPPPGPCCTRDHLTIVPGTDITLGDNR